MSVSKEELKQEISQLETRLDEKFSTKHELVAVKNDLKSDLADLKEEVMGTMASIADDLKRHFDFSVERICSDKNDGVELQLADHEKRLQKLEHRN